MRKLVKHLVPAAATGGLLLAIYAMKGLFPFGENTISWCDMNQQVVPLLCELRDILTGQQSLFYHLQNAGGMNFWGVFLFFIASPFSFLVLLVKKSQMMLLANLLVLLKLMVCAGCASVYFGRVFPKLRPVFGAVLSVSYAFCGYTMLFYQNMVWLDMMYLFPLFLLSLWRLQRTGSFLPYALCLAGMVAVNFYLSYMLVLFLAFAAAIWILFFAPRDTRGQRTVSFAAGTLCAALLSAVVWLPALLQYLRSARGADLWESLTAGSFFSRFHTIGMLLLCTAILTPAFLFQALRCARGEMESRRERYLLCLFCLMLAPVFIEPINKMWHTGSYQAFPGRYGYMIVLLGLTLAGQILQQPVEPACARSSKPWTAGLFLLTGGTAVAGFWLWQRYPKTLTTYIRTLWSSNAALRIFLIFFLLAAGCCGLGLLLYRHRLLTRRLLAVCLCAVTVIQALFFGTCFFSSKSDDSFVEVTDLEGTIQDTGFFRVKNYRKNYDVNLTGAIGYPTLNHYTSLTRESFLQGIRKLGYSSYWMEVSSVGGTLISDALLNQKYTIYSAWDSWGRTAAYTDDNYSVVQNEFVLPLGAVTGADLSEQTQLERTARPYAGESVLQALSGGGSMVQEYEPTYLHNVSIRQEGDDTHVVREGSGDSFIEYQIPAAPETRTYYFDCFDSLQNNLTEPYYQAFSVYVDGALIGREYPTQSSNGILELTVRSNESVRITITVHKDVSVRSFGVFSVSHQALKDNLDAVRTAQMQVGKDSVYGTATAQADGEYLFLSLSYDEGWTATVNGQQAPVLQVFDTWMAIPLSAGENTIELQYRAPGFAAGLVVSIAGVALTLAAGYLLERRGWRIRALEKPAVILFALFAVGLFAIIYLMPVTVYLVGQF